MNGATALVVGGGGFLGRSVVAALERAGDRVVVPQVPWGDTEAAADVLVRAVAGLRAGSTPWRLVWCAGTGIVSTGDEAFAAERLLLDRVLDPAATAPPAGATGTAGTAFLASSAGAVYAGSEGVPFDESTGPRPLAPYGRTRLEAEQRFAAWATTVGARLVIGRIANLYGPGANLDKPQGLVSQLAAAHVEGRPSSIYVPFTTTRDYLYIDDAGAMVADALQLVADRPPGTVVTKIFASQRGHSIADVVAAVSAAFDEELDVRAGHHDSADRHGLDLRFRSTVLTDIDDRDLMPFDEGVQRTVESVRTARGGHRA
ncbi:NAD-dependent epimerase/dehydratase family protein [Curtobacterium sp. MCBD17_021]|uniref:NAD-dependent epimerase/dehydratase family protein n=1 Tax=Curtobacterium sp. MCBD17_021 TaxID=2175665 RepID=UPI000DAA9824|nr:NAD-dependent epimerase/dehydratase family protein [Curtobacterium sp. MCBD17_021]PZE68098.1 NAD(P)-dependent oxidoreductase [Curtobacterium sp. MCBD17_021]